MTTDVSYGVQGQYPPCRQEISPYPSPPGISEFQEALYWNSMGMYCRNIPHPSSYGHQTNFYKFRHSTPPFVNGSESDTRIETTKQVEDRAKEMQAAPMNLRHPRTVSNNLPSVPGMASVSCAATTQTATPPATTLSMVAQTIPTWSDRYKVQQEPTKNTVHHQGQPYFSKEYDRNYTSDHPQNNWQTSYPPNRTSPNEIRLSPPLLCSISVQKSPNNNTPNGRITPPNNGDKDMRRSSLSPLFGNKQADMALVDSVLYNMARNSNPAYQSQTVGNYSHPLVCSSAPTSSMVNGGKATGPGTYQGSFIQPQYNGQAQLNTRVSPKQNLVSSRYSAVLQLSQLSDTQGRSPPMAGNTSFNVSAGSDISIPADYDSVAMRLLSSPDSLFGSLNQSTTANQIMSTNEKVPTTANQITSTNEKVPECSRKRRRSSSSSRDQSKPKNRPLPQHAVDIMLKWYENHIDDPYPSREDIKGMAEAGEIAYVQVRSWFANRRNRNKNTRITNHQKKLKKELSSICCDWMKEGSCDTPNTKKVVDRIIGLIAQNSGQRGKSSSAKSPVTV